MKLRFRAVGFVCGLALLAGVARLWACPFCNVESKTLSEDTNGADAVVLAKLAKDAPTNADPSDPNSGMAKFQIVETLKGQKAVGDAKEIDVVFFGDSDRNKTYLITGLGTDKIDWATPLPLSQTAIEYVRKLPSVAPTGVERLEFFQDYLENADPLLAQDSYDEFARAPYSELLALKPKLKHDRVVKWVADPEISPSRRRLYLTMLGVCGTKADVPLLEEMIALDFEKEKPALVALVGNGLAMGGPVGLPLLIEAAQQDDRRKKMGLDALVACYLVLRGPEGLDLIEERFLKNPHAEYTHVYSTIMALRFHGDQDTGVVPRERLLASMRLLLKNPDFADQVILDLSRWEDWSVLDQMVEMFKTSDEKGYVRQPVVSYLTVASEQQGDVGKRATAAIEELEKLDPETVKTARSLMAFGALGRARGVASATSAASAASAASTTASQGAKQEGKSEGAVTAEQAVSAAKQPVEEKKDTTAALAAGSDAAQGFAASAEDEKTDVTGIPDPAEFGSKAEAQPAAAQQAKSQPAKPQAAEVAGVKAAEGKFHPLLVAGLPLGAAVVLMGVYWLILPRGPYEHNVRKRHGPFTRRCGRRHSVSGVAHGGAYCAGAGLCFGVRGHYGSHQFRVVSGDCANPGGRHVLGAAIAGDHSSPPRPVHGAAIARAGVAMSTLFLVGGVAYGGYVYATEVPDGYTRTSFNTMKPDDIQERSGVIVPPEVAALEGKKVFIKGYIRPDSVTVQQGIDRFLLVRDNNQCCFGNLSKIKYFDQIDVSTLGDLRVNYSQGVYRVGGILHIEPQNAVTGVADSGVFLEGGLR